MQVYHGSYVKIKEIDLSKCIPNKDFGKGFYVTKFRKHAENWAKVIGRRYKTERDVSGFLFPNLHPSHPQGFSVLLFTVKT
jgi:hypothetical protein